jgi:hypothetical protein
MLLGTRRQGAPSDRLASSSYVEAVVPPDVELAPELVPLLDMLGQFPEVPEDVG